MADMYQDKVDMADDLIATVRQDEWLWWVLSTGQGVIRKIITFIFKNVQWIILLKYVETMEFWRGYDLGVLG